MASKQYTIFVVMFLTTIRLSTGNNADYTVCSTTPFSCGLVKNIRYPFWGGNRPQFCGHPNFPLTCQKGPDTVMYHMGNTTRAEYTGSFSASVVNISTSHSTMSLVETPFSYPLYVSCQKLITNETAINLFKPFKFSPTVTIISLFFDCNTTVSNNSRFKSFTCRDENNNISDSAYYFDDKLADDVGVRSCHTRRVFPVLKSELDKLSKGNGSLLGVLMKGFEVEYVVSEYDDCIMCQNSGGSCGSSKNPSTTFVCYCQNGIYPLVCPKSGKKLQNYLGPGIGGVLVLVAVFLILCRRRLKFGKANSASYGRSESELRMESLDLGVPLFSYKQLQEATESFDETRELGDGGYGAVYYGKLKDGREVAVKRLYEKSFKRVEQFMNEVRILTCVRHQNLVSLYGCTSCHSRDLLLVYEYISNGTVADHLYGHKANSGTFLSWSMRLKIAIETASALSYLHATDIIHRDVKTNNILLDKDFNVKVADFGLSRLFPNDVTHVSTAPQGTPGYLDPEYHQCYQLTDKSDVYSFGVVLIELISSLRAVDMDRHNYEINLANYAMNRIQKCAFSDLVDPELGFKSDFKVKRMTIAVAELAFQCLQHYKDFRPSMDEVLEVLQRIQSFEYETLQTEEMLKNEPVQINNFAPSPTDDDGVKLLSNRELFRHSPTSVMEIVSSSTISESTGS